ncbi:COP9 signalosome [Auriculariales sp. MPI-PUGE-AT-0066]|nr:COP9 signalosome [Auriculariales sp. MPI-PUGE-AT-0066]
MSALSQTYQQLTRAFDARSADLAQCGKLLSKLKLAIIENGLYPPRPDAKLEDLVVARDILEIGAFCSIRGQDVPAFDRYFAQLQTFYTDYNTVLPPSKREYPLRGLNLIRLLTQNRIADFHTSLESLPLDALHDNPYIKHPVDLERWLMEGSYSKVWSARQEAPAEEYGFFVDSLMGTIRNEIASCEEAAYDSIPLKDASTLLFFTSRSDLMQYAQQRGWQISLQDEKIIFARKGEEKVEIPKQKLILNNLSYARELEQIV